MGEVNAFIGGILGLIVLILDLIAIFEIITSTRNLFPKILWILGILIFPVLGCIIYYFCSNREKHKPNRA
ncbi:PLDc_N domain-containing protein [Rhizophagus clarus]|uniref:PLDc_N domain-containing protein n=1 Tax=Rhizophagus clarus TaxID=94130 RepID=A0A8H3KX20_9GLOM|nr:PLDc_N domain-containing protein [Rhizophagus clarus]